MSTKKNDQTEPDAVEQAHPLYKADRDRVDTILGHAGVPANEHLTTCAMLMNRYDDFPGAQDIKDDLNKLVNLWGLDRDSLNTKCREIWRSGWRPGVEIRGGSDVGSGADVDTRDD